MSGILAIAEIREFNKDSMNVGGVHDLQMPAGRFSQAAPQVHPQSQIYVLKTIYVCMDRLTANSDKPRNVQHFTRIFLKASLRKAMTFIQ